jgi:hypothetical protein
MGVSMLGLGETNLIGFILMTSFLNSPTISLLRFTRDPQAIIAVDTEGERTNGGGEGALIPGRRRPAAGSR